MSNVMNNTAHTTLAPEVAAERVVGFVRTRQWAEAEDIARHYELCHRYMTSPHTQDVLRPLWADMPHSLREVLINLEDYNAPVKA